MKRQLNIKRFVSLILACVMTMSLASAAAPENMETNSIELTTIDKSDVPANVIPLAFDSEEDARAYIQNTLDELAQNNNIAPVYLDESSSLARATYGNATVAEKSFGAGSVFLKANYKTSGDGNTGSISYINPYTAMTGFTLGFNWVTNDIGYQLSASKKDAFIYCSGVLEYYLLINGLIKLGASEVNLGNTVWIIR